MSVTYRIEYLPDLLSLKQYDGATCGAGSAYPSGAPEITPRFWWDSCCLFFSFLCCIMCTIGCLFVFFIFSHGVVSLFRFMSLTVPLVSFVPLLLQYDYIKKKTSQT